MKATYHGVIALHLDQTNAMCHALGTLVNLGRSAGTELPGADDGFSTDLQLDAHFVETWATYDDGVVASPGNGPLPLPANLAAGRELTQLYERLIRDAKAANPAFFDAAEDDVTWAIVWPRPLSASVETLLAHRWAFWAAAEALDEEAYRMIALDAVVCEIRGRLASAHASKGASYEPGPLAAAALDIAVCWRRARSVITNLQHRLLPNPVERPRDLGFLGTFATGALAEALHDAVEWAEDTWENAVMDEARVRERGVASPYRIKHGLVRFTKHRSIAVARNQAIAEWKSELFEHLLGDACKAVVSYIKLKTSIELSADELMDHVIDDDPAGLMHRLREELPARFGFALGETVHDLPWPAPCVENNEELVTDSDYPWITSWNDTLSRALFSYEEPLRTLFLGCGQETVADLGSVVARGALLCLRSHCEREAGVPGFSNPWGTSAVWVGGSRSEHAW